MKCYSIIFEVLEDLESFEDDSNPAMQRLRSQTYELVYGSDDELFHQALYDWYVSRGQHDRLLEVSTNTLPSLTFRFKLLLSKDTWNIKQQRLYSKPIYYGNSMPKTQITMNQRESSTNWQIQISPSRSKNALNTSPAQKVYVPYEWNQECEMHSMSKLH